MPAAVYINDTGRQVQSFLFLASNHLANKSELIQWYKKEKEKEIADVKITYFTTTVVII